MIGTMDRHEIQVSRVVPSRLPQSIADTVTQRYLRGETVVVVERDGDIVGAIAVTTPLRPEALPAVTHLLALGLSSSILSGDSDPAVQTVAAELGITSARSNLSPADKVDALTSMRQDHRQLLMVGDGINDAPALAAADVGCAIGSGSEAALANSDIALLGNDLQGVPAAIGVAGSTYSVILQNFGWAMGYNVSALPLAAFGLLDPLVAAVAMGLSSLLVVLNSLAVDPVRSFWAVGHPRSPLHAGPARCRRVGIASGGPVRQPHGGQRGGLSRPWPGPPSRAAFDHDRRAAAWWFGGDVSRSGNDRSQSVPRHLQRVEG